MSQNSPYTDIKKAMQEYLHVLEKNQNSIINTSIKLASHKAKRIAGACVYPINNLVSFNVDADFLYKGDETERICRFLITEKKLRLKVLYYKREFSGPFIYTQLAISVPLGYKTPLWSITDEDSVFLIRGKEEDPIFDDYCFFPFEKVGICNRNESLGVMSWGGRLEDFMSVAEVGYDLDIDTIVLRVDDEGDRPNVPQLESELLILVPEYCSIKNKRIPRKFENLCFYQDIAELQMQKMIDSHVIREGKDEISKAIGLRKLEPFGKEVFRPYSLSKIKSILLTFALTALVLLVGFKLMEFIWLLLLL